MPSSHSTVHIVRYTALSIVDVHRLICYVSLFPHLASFRFHLTMDTLTFGYILPTTGRIRDLHPLETCAARRTHKNISIISKENDGDIFCLFLQQPISYIVNFDSFIAILWMFGPGNNHFRISISDLKQRRAFSLKCFLPGNVVADLNVNLLAASLSYKVDFFLIELVIIPGLFEPPVRTLRATLPENESHIFR